MRTLGSQSMSSVHSQCRLPSSPSSAARMLTTRSTSVNSKRCGTSASRSFGPISGASSIIEKIWSITSRTSSGEEKDAPIDQEELDDPDERVERERDVPEDFGPLDREVPDDFAPDDFVPVERDAEDREVPDDFVRDAFVPPDFVPRERDEPIARDEEDRDVPDDRDVPPDFVPVDREAVDRLLLPRPVADRAAPVAAVAAPTARLRAPASSSATRAARP